MAMAPDITGEFDTRFIKEISDSWTLVPVPFPDINLLYWLKKVHCPWEIVTVSFHKNFTCIMINIMTIIVSRETKPMLINMYSKLDKKLKNLVISLLRFHCCLCCVLQVLLENKQSFFVHVLAVFKGPPRSTNSITSCDYNISHASAEMHNHTYR